MPFKVIYDTETRAILVIDPQPDPLSGVIALPSDRQTALATLANPERAKFDAAYARFTLAEGDTTIEVEDVGPPAPTEHDVAKLDLSNQYSAMQARLTDIVQDGPAFTGAQVRDAVVDLARFQRAVSRLLKNIVT